MHVKLEGEVCEHRKEVAIPGLGKQDRAIRASQLRPFAYPASATEFPSLAGCEGKVNGARRRAQERHSPRGVMGWPTPGPRGVPRNGNASKAETSPISAHAFWKGEHTGMDWELDALDILPEEGESGW